MKKLLLAALVAGVALPASAEILERILVKVNGEIITQTSFEQRQINYIRQSNRQDAIQDEESLKKLLAEVTPELIVNAVDEVLLVQRGKELGYRMTDEQFTEIVERIRKENNIETEEQFQAALEQESMTMEDLRRALERQMLISRVQQTEIFNRIGVTEQEERVYYEAHKDEFRMTPQVTLREILVEVPESTTDTATGAQPAINVGLEEEARARAEAARARVEAGEDFAAVAGEVSDAASKANGGLIGPLNRSELAPELAEALEPLQEGEMSPVLRTPRGYHILQLVSGTTDEPQAFEDVQDQIAQALYNQRRRQEFEKYMKKLRDQAIIEWKSEELQKAYEQRLAELASASSAT